MQAQDLADEDHSNEFFAAGDQGMTPNGVEYIRTIPDQYGEETPNTFMRKMYDNFALEQKNAKGEPSGNFRMDAKQTRAAAMEVVEHFKGLKGADLDKFMNQYFQRTWEHFDVNHDNYLEVLDMPAFMKFICSDQSIDLDSLYKAKVAPSIDQII